MNDWKNYVGKEYSGRQRGRYKVIEYDAYSGNLQDWTGKNALFIQSISSVNKRRVPLMTDVLSIMIDRFESSQNMDKAFNSFCEANNIPKLPSQHAVESYYVSFYEYFINTAYEPKIELNDNEQGLVSSVEGNPHRVYTTKYERDPKLRKLAIEIHGTSCMGCDFNFGKVYGEYGDGFIHIHHSIPVSKYEGAKMVKPEKDLFPLCANCHSIVHRRKNKTLTIEELKRLIKKTF
jgi:hypothetical protein